MKTTPAPWKAVQMGYEWNIAAGGEKYRVASLQSNIERARNGEVAGNAHLIAAAPDLLAVTQGAIDVLKRLKTHFDHDGTQDIEDIETQEFIDAYVSTLQAAINKAKGR
jgi:hypothetical protein